MSDEIFVQTDKVAEAAARITHANQAIDTAFDEMERAIQRLNKSWTSPASDTVIGYFSSISSHFKSNRFAVMKDYSHFLLGPVVEGYTAAENENVRLADAFK